MQRIARPACLMWEGLGRAGSGGGARKRKNRKNQAKENTMQIAAFSVKNYQFTLIVFVMLAALGLSSLLNMPKAEDPEMDAPMFIITAIYPGAGPADMERLVADPIERKVSELSDIKLIETNIDDGVAVLRVEYVYSSNAEEKYQEIVREVNSVESELPDDLYELRVNRISPSDVNILQIALVSENAPYRVLQEQADRLREALERIKTMKNAKTWGLPEQQVRITLQLDKMAQSRIPLSRVMGALQSESVNIPGGNIYLSARKYNVKTSGDYASLDEIRRTVVYSDGTKIIYLGDIAEVDLVDAPETHITRFNGHRAVLVTAAQKSNQNIFAVREAYTPVLAAFEKQLPPNIAMIRHFDQADSVGSRLGRFAKDFLIAILLVSLTLLPLGFRASLVVMISIPLSIAMGLTGLSLLGYSINQLSIVGFIIALGILVDDSIVVVENIERHLRMGKSKKQAAIEATQQIGLAVVGCTVTLVLAFLPLLFLPEASGDFIRSLPVAVVATVLASLFVSLTIVPFLSSRILGLKHDARGNLFMRGLNWLIQGTYARLLDKALIYPKTTLLVALLLFGGVLSLVPKVGFSLFPASEKPMFTVNVSLPEGSAIMATDSVVRHVESVLGEHPKVRFYTANTGKGNPRIYYNEIQRNEAANYGQVFVQLLPDVQPKEKEAIIDELRERFIYYPNAKIEVKNFEQGPPVDAPIAIRVFGEDLDTLRKVATQVEDIISGTPGTIYVNNPLSTLRTDLKVRINKEKAGMMGIPTAEIDRTVRLAVAGLNVGSFTNAAGDDYDMIATVEKGKYPNLDVFDRTYVNSVTGMAVPLRQVADIEFQSSPPLIKHFDKERFITVSSFVQTGFLANNVNEEVVSQLKQMTLPAGYRYGIAGEAETRAESFGGMGAIIVITLFGFLGVLVLEFGTFKSTLIVLSVIPLGIIGAILMLLGVGYTFSFVAVVGLIALAGIEVKNSILLVDFTNQLRREGMPLEEAIRKAGEVRFVPIVLTSLTAIGGLTPLAIEFNPLYSPLAWVLIGGLISSTLLSRVVTPVLYKILPPGVGGRGE